MTRVLVTGAAGFVGSALLARLHDRGTACVGAVRGGAQARGDGDRVAPRGFGQADEGVGGQGQEGEGCVVVGGSGRAGEHCVAVGDFAAARWEPVLAGVEVVVHLAAMAHRGPGIDAATYFRENVEVTRRLLEAAIGAGVRRFVFASSVKVNGEQTHGRPFTEDDPPQPEDAYGRSKRAAEEVVAAAADAIETVTLRLPLVYGPGVKGNMLALLRAVDRGWPLPLATVRNARSLLAIGNLLSALEVAIVDPAVAGGIFLLSDGEDLGTPELVRRLAAALSRPARLFAVSPVLLGRLAALAGRGDQARRLLGSLQVDSGRFRGATGWHPPCTVDKELARMARWYRGIAV